MDTRLNIKTENRKMITLRELCRGLEIELPAKFEPIADEYYPIVFSHRWVKKGDICLIVRSLEDYMVKGSTSKRQYDIARNNGARVIIMGRGVFEACGLNEDDYPVILMDDSRKNIAALLSKLRAAQKGKVVMLTGSVGKTTTKDFCYTLAKDHFRTFANQKNTNTPPQAFDFMFANYNKEYDVYIQEVGAGFRGSVRFGAEILKPNIFILTNVYNHHFQIYETKENLFEDKTSPDDELSDDGVVITNYDEENLRSHHFKHRVIFFGIKNPDVDYRAENIMQDIEVLSFDVLERATGIRTPIRIHILGEHNVYNALAAYAMGRTLGLSPEEIKEDFFHYKTSGIRQNLVNIGGVYIMMDCYNVAEESLHMMLQASDKIELKNGGRKIGMLGGENKLGEDVRERSLAFGKALGNYSLDKYLFCGRDDLSISSLNHYGDAQDLQAGLREVSDTPSELACGIEEMRECLERNVRRNDLLLVKGIYYLDMPVAVDKAFGTSFSFTQSNYIDVMKKYRTENFSFRVIAEFQEAEVSAATIEQGRVNIPDKLQEFPVFRIAPKAFAGKKNLKRINLGHSVKNIGSGAFAESGLVEITVPGNVKVIEDRAFAGIKALGVAVLEDGVTHIGEEAFADCAGLRACIIPASVGMIETDAFRDSPCILVVEEGSFAHQYAEENGLEYALRRL